MAADINYDRPKVAVTNDTPINFTIDVSENPDALAAIGGTGTTGIMDAQWNADADESGGVDIQPHALFTITPTLSASGQVTYTVVFTPVLGDASNGTPFTLTFVHQQNMDVWQTAAGRARQA